MLNDKKSLRFDSIKITEMKKVLKNMVKTYEVPIIEYNNPLMQFFKTKLDVVKKTRKYPRKRW